MNIPFISAVAALITACLAVAVWVGNWIGAPWGAAVGFLMLVGVLWGARRYEKRKRRIVRHQTTKRTKLPNGTTEIEETEMIEEEQEIEGS